MGIPFGSFKTVTKLLVTNDDVYQTIRERSSLQSYPFDKYAIILPIELSK